MQGISKRVVVLSVIAATLLAPGCVGRSKQLAEEIVHTALMKPVQLATKIVKTGASIPRTMIRSATAIDISGPPEGFRRPHSASELQKLILGQRIYAIDARNGANLTNLHAYTMETLWDSYGRGRVNNGKRYMLFDWRPLSAGHVRIFFPQRQYFSILPNLWESGFRSPSMDSFSWRYQHYQDFDAYVHRASGQVFLRGDHLAFLGNPADTSNPRKEAIEAQDKIFGAIAMALISDVYHRAETIKVRSKAEPGFTDRDARQNAEHIKQVFKKLRRELVKQRDLSRHFAAEADRLGGLGAFWQRCQVSAAVLENAAIRMSTGAKAAQSEAEGYIETADQALDDLKPVIVGRWMAGAATATMLADRMLNGGSGDAKDAFAPIRDNAARKKRIRLLPDTAERLKQGALSVMQANALLQKAVAGGQRAEQQCREQQAGRTGTENVY